MYVYACAWQILPYYFLDVMGDYRGVPGMILASVFAAALR